MVKSFRKLFIYAIYQIAHVQHRYPLLLIRKLEPNNLNNNYLSSRVKVSQLDLIKHYIYQISSLASQLSPMVLFALIVHPTTIPSEQ